MIIKQLAMSCLFLAPVAAEAAEVTLLTGNEASSYHRVLGQRFAAVLGPFFDIRLEGSAGGVQNIQAVMANRMAMGLAQQDVFEDFVAANPEARSKIEFYPTGQSCLFAVVRRNGPIATYADMTALAAKRPLVLDIGPNGGETTVTYATLSQQEPALQAAKLQHRGGLRAISHVDMGDTDVALFMLPLVPQDDILSIVNQSTSLALLPMASHAFEAPLPDGRRPYTLQQVAARPGGMFTDEVTYSTACTGVGIVVNAASDANLLEAIATVALSGRLPTASTGVLETVGTWVQDTVERLRGYLPWKG